MLNLNQRNNTRSSSCRRRRRHRSSPLVALFWMLGVATTHVWIHRTHSSSLRILNTSRHRQQQVISSRLSLTRLFAVDSKNQTHTETQHRSSNSMASTTINTDTANGVASIGAKRVTVEYDMEAAGARLRAGDLVAFPTETVYGLGCHALDPAAIQKVFAAKERPASDPLISHVLDKQQAFSLWKAGSTPGSEAHHILSTLCDAFWPGPLTLVAVAAEHVPDSLMAGTGYCAVRSPSHAVSRALIQAAAVPIAAPSANKFGHVSPTTADHVWDDLHKEDVWILQHADEQLSNGASFSGKSSCNVGVESTVAKLEMDASDVTTGTLTVLRQGAVSVAELHLSLQTAGFDGIQVAAVHRATGDHVAHVAPGQTIRHYSPNTPSFLVSKTCLQGDLTDAEKHLLQSCIVIDFGQRLAAWKDLCREYRDLSVTADSAQACAAVFETLRWTEHVSDCTHVLFPELPVQSEDALAMALKDRLTRAASGMVWDRLRTGTDA